MRLLLFILLVASALADRSAYGKFMEEVEKKAGRTDTATRDYDLDQGVKELVKLYRMHDKGKLVDPKSPPPKIVQDVLDQRPKAMAAHFLEAFRRARTGEPDLCGDINQMIGGAAPPLSRNRGEAVPRFEYIYYGPGGRQSCTTCTCTMNVQQSLGAPAGSLEFQVFREGTVAIAKEEESGYSDSYYFYFGSDTSIARIEHYRTPK